jgi:DNA-binding transcriptional MerR regulator
MPIKSMREYASLRRHGVASAGRRKALLVEQRRSVAERIAELQGCLDVLDYKIDNYDRIEQKVLGVEAGMEGISA